MFCERHMKVSSDASPLRAYILRGWIETTDDREEVTWRFHLRNVQTGTEQGFTGVAALITFLREEFGTELDSETSYSE